MTFHGKATIFSVVDIGEKGIRTDTKQTSSEEINNAFPGRLFQNCIRVRSTSIAANSVNVDSTNHALWNKLSDASKTYFKVKKVKMSKAVLIKPKTIMKPRNRCSDHV